MDALLHLSKKNFVKALKNLKKYMKKDAKFYFTLKEGKDERIVNGIFLVFTE